MGASREWGHLRDGDGAEGLLLGADSLVLLSSQFTQSALDCMSVEVGRLRAFLQVRAQLDLSKLVFFLSPCVFAPGPNTDVVPHLFLFPE